MSTSLKTNCPSGEGDLEKFTITGDECEKMSNTSPTVFDPDSIRLRAAVHQPETNQVLIEKQPLLLCGDSLVESKQDLTEVKTFSHSPLGRSEYSTFILSISIALLLRITLLLFSLWQDRTRWPDGQLRFTDVDYDVFTDAARALVSGKDIYEARPSYRYSPLIAVIVAPGHWFERLRSGQLPDNSSIISTLSLEDNFQSGIKQSFSTTHSLSKLWGKLVFILADLVCAWLQYKIILLESQIHPDGETDPDASKSTKKTAYLATFLVSFGWLFNPITAVVSVRGNAEAVLGVCVLSCLLFLLKRRIFFAGLLFGLCVHLKLYPVIYIPAIYLWLTTVSKFRSTSAGMRVRAMLPSWKHFSFGLATLISLTVLTYWGYVYFGGMRFLHQAYLYHFRRSDIKHNFAPHFYPLYLLSGLKWKATEHTSLTDSLFTSVAHNHDITNGLFDRLRSTMSQFIGTALPTSEGLINWITNQMFAHADTLSRMFNVIAFLPALVLIPGLSFKLYRHLGLCWFVVTHAFVTFNKVCTSQYFLWSLVLLPVAVPSIRLPPNTSTRCAILENLLLWFGAQAFWLASAYTLEMRTSRSALVARFVWPLVWFASVLFFIINVVLLRRFVKWQRPCSCAVRLGNKTTSVTRKSKKIQ